MKSLQCEAVEQMAAIRRNQRQGAGLLKISRELSEAKPGAEHRLIEARIGDFVS
jgi:hypothetical protein